MSAGNVVAALRSHGFLEADELPVTDARPTPYWGPFPIRSHRTMAEVMADEALAARPAKCAKCGQWRRVRCGYRTCPAGMPEAAAPLSSSRQAVGPRDA